MNLTKQQIKEVNAQVRASLSAIIADAHDREAVLDSIIIDVISDIEDTADWSDYEDDECNLSDIDIALARVLKNKICGRRFS